MSSATSTDAGFKPWHFFVLASLSAATVAVLMSRRSTPEHLVLLSLTIGAAGAAAAACYRMLAPLAVGDAAVQRERRSQRAHALIEREKGLVLRSIKELEFDRAMGKVSPKDFEEMSGRLRARAIMLMKQVDAGGSGYTELIERELSARMTARGARSRPGDDVRAKSSEDVRVQPGDDVRIRPDASENADVAIAPADLARDLDLTADAAASTCSGCGTLNDPDAVFCKRCGARLRVVPS
jgi:hypothetical protein